MALQPDDREAISMELSIQMLKDVLDGVTYGEVGARHGIARTAVERRIKDLARQLNRIIGIEGINDEGIAFVRRLRANRLSILGALDGLAPELVVPQRKDKEIRVYTTEEIMAAARRVHTYSSLPQRDVAMFLLLFATGLRPLEVARLVVGDYLQADGCVRRISELRAEAAISGLARPLYFASSRLDEVLLPYLKERAGGDSAPETTDFLGLNPAQSLFLAADDQGFEITVYYRGTQPRYLCRPILEVYRKIFRYAGLPGASPVAVRTTVAARLYARGAEDRQVRVVLGISRRSSVQHLVPHARPSLVHLLEELI
jgi:integrase